MKKSTLFLCVITLVFSIVGRVNATPLTPFLDVHTAFINPFDDIKIDENTTFVFNLINDDLFIGDINNGDIIDSATLHLGLTDDRDRRRDEYTDLRLDGDRVLNNFEVGFLDYLSFNVETYLENYKLRVQFRDVQGDFYLYGLTVSGDYNQAPVPEPATILLFSSGVLALFGSRKKFNK